MTIENSLMELKFSKILSAALKGKNISSVARAVGLPKTTLHDWAKSKRVPSLHNIEQIKCLADYLGFSLEELLIGENQKKIISSVSFQEDNKIYRVQIERIK